MATIVEKHTESHVISTGKAAVPVRSYYAKVNIQNTDVTYDVLVTEDVYEQMEEGQLVPVTVYANKKDSMVTSVSFCF